LNTNPGLRSRIPHVINFKDYTTEELMQIANLTFQKKGYILAEAARAKLQNKVEKARYQEQFGNGRYIRNIYEKTIRNQAVRLQTKPDLTVEDLTMIIAEDIFN
jgi:hypothetical protein